MEEIYSYLDYRKLLKDLYKEFKERNPNFTYRYIARRVGFKSPGFFSNILNGKRNISQKTSIGLSEVFKLKKKEADYFEILVQYNQAGSFRSKKYYFEKLLEIKKTKVHELAKDQYKYFDEWYNVAIRELMNFYDFKGDFLKLGNKLKPEITPVQARNSVDLLKKLGLIKENDEGKYELTEKTVTSYPDVPKVAVQSFQRSMIDLAKESMDRFPEDRRSLSTLTLSLSQESYDKIEEKLGIFRREILDLVKRDKNNVDRVYQFNFQIFPLTE